MGKDPAAEIEQAGRQALDGEPLDRPCLLSLARLAAQAPHDLLYWAHRVRQKHFGNRVSFCSIIPGKVGGCGEDCKWCAQSARNSQLPIADCRLPDSDQPERPAATTTQRTSLTDINAAAAQADGHGVGCFSIVNSGRRPSPMDLTDVAAAYETYRQGGVSDGAMRLAVSLGELTPDAARRLVQAGVVRYHHNLETSRRFYGNVVSTHSYEDRLRTLRIAREAGMEICCGGLLGMGETWEDRIDLALTLRDEVFGFSTTEGTENTEVRKDPKRRPVDSPKGKKPPESNRLATRPTPVVPMNFLHPIPGTPLENVQPLAPMEILTIIAVFRLAMPTADLKIAGGRHVNLRDLQSWMFYAGATSLLVGNYLTTAGRPIEQDIQMVRDLGLELVRQVGRHRS